MPQVAHLKALSIRQPFVERILLGEKRAEYRNWTISYRGPILIHASKSTEQEGSKDLPRGVLLGLVEITHVFCRGDYYAWILKNPVRFKTPIPFVGKVGLMSVPWSLVADTELVVPPASTYSTWSRSIPNF